MKFLKQKNISKFSITDQTLFANHYGRAVMNLTGAVRLPKGTTAQRPDLSLVRTLGGADGFIRYNTSINPITNTPIGIEAYVDGVWEVVRAPGATTIVKQTLGPGNNSEVAFGPLTKTPSSDNNIIVLVENVFQISETNFNLSYNHNGSGDTFIVFTEPVPSAKFATVYFGFNN